MDINRCNVFLNRGYCSCNLANGGGWLCDEEDTDERCVKRMSLPTSKNTHRGRPTLHAFFGCRYDMPTPVPRVYTLALGYSMDGMIARMSAHQSLAEGSSRIMSSLKHKKPGHRRYLTWPVEDLDVHPNHIAGRLHVRQKAMVWTTPLDVGRVVNEEPSPSSNL